MTELRAGGATHVGQVRSSNQDAYLIEDDQTLYGVADGMGGHKGGEVASAIAIETLKEHASTASLDDLKEAARKGNRAIFEKAGAESGLHGMGTTLCAVRVVDGPEGDEIGWINVGDSRIYLFRDDRLLQLSRDHSLVEDLLRDGQLTEDEAKVHPKRNIITRALGIDVDVDVDGATVIPFNGDRYLLCSDGLFGEVSDDQITSVLRRLSDPTEAADELVRLANEAGGRDNITVVVVEVIDDGGRSLLAAEALAEQESRLKARQEEEAAMMAAAKEAAGVVDDEPYVPAMADRRSSLPEAPEDLRSEKEDLYEDLEGLDSKRFTWRVVVFVVAIVGVIAVIFGAILWSGTSTYYVAFEGDQVVLYQGKPGGVLWIKPTYDQSTPLERDQLSQADRKAIEDNKQFGSKADALTYVLKLQTAAATTTTTTTTTTAATTTTTSASTTSTAPQATTSAAPTTTRP